MQLTDILAQTGGLQSMSRELGVSEDQAKSGAAALAPHILGGFQKHAQSGGLEGDGGLLGKLGGGALLDDVVSPQPTDLSRGNNVLSHLFGSKDESRAIAHDAASKSGLEPSLMKKMLPMVAMMMAGHMAKQGSHSMGMGSGMGGLGGLAGMAGNLLGGRR